MDTSFLGLPVVLVLVSLAFVHFYWAAGGLWGLDNSIPKNTKGVKIFSPNAVHSLAVALTLIVFAVFTADNASLISLQTAPWISTFMKWAIGTLFILRSVGDFKYVGFFKKVKGSQFSNLDSKMFSPLCLVIGIVVLML